MLNLWKILLFFTFIYESFGYSAGGNFGGGKGTEESPYLIEDIDDFQKISALYVQGANASINHRGEGMAYHFILMDDLDFKGKTIRPVCIDNPRGFRGFFDGNNKSILNFKIQLPEKNRVGLFSFISSGVIKNLTLKRCEVSGNSVIGVLVGSIQTLTPREVLIENCHIIGSRIDVKAVSENQEYTIAGIFAGENIALYSNSIITNCHVSDSEIRCRAQKLDTIGGFVGWNGALAKTINLTVAGIKKSTVQCDFKFKTHNIKNMGGLVGRNEAVAFWDNSKAMALLQDCSANCDVKGLYRIGGLAGSCEAFMTQSTVLIERCYAKCEVEGIGNKDDIPFFIGGLIGMCSSNSAYSAVEVRDCFFSGRVRCKKSGNQYIGGLIGLVFDRQKSNNLKITHSYAQGHLSICGQSFPYTAGGFVGGNDNGEYEHCYWIGKVLPGENDKFERGNRPVPISSAEASKKPTFIDWDFNKVWTIENGRPSLRRNE